MAGQGGAFIAGAILAKMLMDTSGWSQGAKTVQKESDAMGKKTKGIADGLGSIGKTMTVVGGIVAGGMLAMTRATANAGDEVAKLSQRTGISTETLSSYKRALELSDASLGTFAMGMKILSNNMMDAEAGNKAAIAKFAELGVSATDVSGKMRPLDQVFLDISDKMAAMEDGARKNALATGIMSRAGMELIPTMNMGSAALKTMADESRRMGLIFDKEAAAASERFNDSLDDLKMSLRGAFQQVALTVMPIISELAEKIKGVMIRVQEWTKEHPVLVQWITKMALAIGGTMLVLGPFLITLSKMVKAFTEMKVVLAAVNWTNFVQGALVAGAALAGWNLGRWIGEVTGLDKVYERCFDSAFKFLGVAKEIGKLNEENHTSMEAMRMEALARASELAGKQIEKISEAQRILVSEYEKVGTTGSAAIDSMVGKWKEGIGVTDAAKSAHDKLAKSVADAAKSAEEAAAAAEREKVAYAEFISFLNMNAIQTIEQQNSEIAKLWNWQDRLNAMLKVGQIDAEHYARAMALVVDQMAKYASIIATVLPKARDMNTVLEQVPEALEDQAYGIESAADAWLRYVGAVPVDVPPGIDKTTAAIKEQGHEWDGLFNSVTQNLADLIESFAKGEMSITTMWNRMWKNARETFFTTIAQMASKWLVDFVKTAILGGAKSAVNAIETVGKGVGNLAGNVSNAASGIQGALSGLATGIGSIISSIATGIGTGIAAIATGVGAAIVTLATAIASAATILAAAAPALLIVGGIALAVYAGFAAINALLSSASGGAGDGMGRVVERLDRFLAGWSWWYQDVIAILVYIQSRMDIIVDQLGSMQGGMFNADVFWMIEENTKRTAEAIEKLKKAQHGLVIREPSLVMMGEEGPRNPEIAMPMNDYRSVLAAAGGRGGNNVTLDFKAYYQINAIDAESVRGIVRKKIGPETIAWIRMNMGKEEMQAALGI